MLETAELTSYTLLSFVKCKVSHSKAVKYHSRATAIYWGKPSPTAVSPYTTWRINGPPLDGQEFFPHYP